MNERYLLGLCHDIMAYISCTAKRSSNSQRRGRNHEGGGPTQAALYRIAVDLQQRRYWLLKSASSRALDMPPVDNMFKLKLKRPSSSAFHIQNAWVQHMQHEPDMHRKLYMTTLHDKTSGPEVCACT